jgi:hypothetical protein
MLRDLILYHTIARKTTTVSSNISLHFQRADVFNFPLAFSLIRTGLIPVPILIPIREVAVFIEDEEPHMFARRNIILN